MHQSLCIIGTVLTGDQRSVPSGNLDIQGKYAQYHEETDVTLKMYDASFN